MTKERPHMWMFWVPSVVKEWTKLVCQGTAFSPFARDVYWQMPTHYYHLNYAAVWTWTLRPRATKFRQSQCQQLRVSSLITLHGHTWDSKNKQPKEVARGLHSDGSGVWSARRSGPRLTSVLRSQRVHASSAKRARKIVTRSCVTGSLTWSERGFAAEHHNPNKAWLNKSVLRLRSGTVALRFVT